MLLCNLPEDILILVLRKCLTQHHFWAHGHKRNLMLLAVCRLWRHLAFPMVYGHLFIEYEERRNSGGAQSTLNSSAEGSIDVAVTTNLGLIEEAGCAGVVKRATIYVNCMVSPFAGWREVIQRMQVVASKWHVAELAAMMHPSYSYNGYSVDVAEYANDVAEVGSALAALMPDVRRLKCAGSDRSPIANSLYGCLAGQYAEQLQWLDSPNAIVVPQNFKFTRLQNVGICCSNDANHQLPQMVSRELVDMRLFSGQCNHSWAPFSASCESREIEFTNLNRLDVAYFTTHQEDGVSVRHRDGHPWKLRFPSLKSLDIKCTESTCPLLEYAVLPPRMESISICMDTAAFQDSANVVLPAAKCLSLRIFMQSGDDPSGLSVIGRMLKSARGSEVLELQIGNNGLPMVPESITRTALTHLQVSAPTSVDAMLALIGGLPCLLGLTLFSLDLSDVQVDISVPDADEDVVVDPLHALLKGLAINYDRARNSPDMAVAVVKYMLLRIPSLAVLYAAQAPRDPVLNFVEAYAPRHPHLGSVDMMLYQDEHSANVQWSIRAPK